jgi:hypothetical protein
VIRAQRSYLAAVLSAIAGADPAQQPELAPLARAARLAYMGAQDTIARALVEPARQGDAQQSHSVLGTLRRIVSVVHVLRTDVKEQRGAAPLPELAVLAAQLDRTLAGAEARLGQHPATQASAQQAVPPDLRESYTHLAERADLRRADPLLVAELDELVDAVNSLAALVPDARSVGGV